MIPIHATATSDPQRVRFVVPAANLPARGAVRHAPGRLGGWLRRGVIAEMSVHDAGVLVTLSDQNSWRDLGEDIRDALAAALLETAEWQVAAATDTDHALFEVATELLAGPVGAYAQSHGGAIDLVSVSGEHVTVRMSGACRGCPASSSTLTDLLERQLRQRVSRPITVSADHDSARASVSRRLLIVTR